MRTKQYATEKVAEVAKRLSEAPMQPPKYLDHARAMEELEKTISELFFKKNYDERQITKMLKESGIKTTLKEVKSIVKSKKDAQPKKA